MCSNETTTSIDTLLAGIYDGRMTIGELLTNREDFADADLSQDRSHELEKV